MLLDNQNLFCEKQEITTGEIFSQNIISFGKNDVSFAPFVNYKIAKTRGAQKYRSNTTVGLSLGYQTDYKIW